MASTQMLDKSALSESELIQRAQRGDRNAFGVLVRECGPRLHRAIYYLTGNPEDAADLTQEAFYRAYRALASFEVCRPFYPWLYRIARNLTSTHRKRRSRTVNLGDQDALLSDVTPDPDAALVTEQENAALHRALGELSSEHREIIILKHFENSTYAEMAEILEIPVGTVMSRLYNARMNLKKVLLKEESQ
jgi:RNA polymerase sigma-70 factor (ECF subfamily)